MFILLNSWYTFIITSQANLNRLTNMNDDELTLGQKIFEGVGFVAGFSLLILAYAYAG